MGDQNTLNLVREYLSSRRLRENAAQMESKYKAQLMALLEQEGEEDDRGSSYISLGAEIVDPRTEEPVVAIKRERRVSQSLDEDVAEEVLRGLGLYERCLHTITVLDEDVILSLNFSGELPDDAVQQMYSEKESFAFKVLGS